MIGWVAGMGLKVS